MDGENKDDFFLSFVIENSGHISLCKTLVFCLVVCPEVHFPPYRYTYDLQCQIYFCSREFIILKFFNGNYCNIITNLLSNYIWILNIKHKLIYFVIPFVQIILEGAPFTIQYDKQCFNEGIQPSHR